MLQTARLTNDQLSSLVDAQDLHCGGNRLAQRHLTGRRQHQPLVLFVILKRQKDGRRPQPRRLVDGDLAQPPTHVGANVISFLCRRDAALLHLGNTPSPRIVIEARLTGAIGVQRTTCAFVRKKP